MCMSTFCMSLIVIDGCVWSMQEKDLEVKSMQEQLGRSRDALERTRIEAMQIGSAKASEQLQVSKLCRTAMKTTA